MWKVSGKRIFPRWQKIHRAAIKNKNPKPKERPVALCVATEKGQSNGESKWKQDARQQHSFWDDLQFANHTLCSTLLETVGIVGTAAFCLDFQHRHYGRLHVKDNGNPCMFSKLAYAMPFGSKRKASCQTAPQSEAGINVKQPETPEKKNNDEVSVAAEKLHNATMDSVAAIENSIGLMYLEKDDKQAFEFFQASAQLECPKGLFNLGICYEQGRGTRKNLSKAANCYKRAALKGHGLATYNLAVFTLNGLGGIQENFDKGIELLKEAAEKNVPQAQLHLGRYYLEEKNYDGAYKMFKDSAQNNNVDAKYYLGCCYEEGWGVEKNCLIATEMFAEAARKGHEEATIKLGNCFETGNAEMDPDTDFSMVLYRMLAEKGHRGGKRAMQTLKAKEESAKMINAEKISARRKSTEIQNEPETTATTTLHSSSSVPEFRNYPLYYKMYHSKSVVHSMMSLNDIQHVEPVGGKPFEARNFDCLKYASRKPAASFQLSMSQVVLANS